MKSVNKLAIKASMLAAMSVLASAAQAATWVEVSPASGFVIAGSAVTYSPSPALQVKYYDDNLVPQSPSGCTAGTTAGWSGGVNSYTSAAGYDYLAIHFGQRELVSRRAAPIAAGATFTVAGVPKDLSNCRAFISAVPEPETYPLLLAGLGMPGFLARRRQGKQVSSSAA